MSLRSMLASNTDKKRPPGDAEYCARVGNRSPKLSNVREGGAECMACTRGTGHYRCGEGVEGRSG